MIIILFFLVGYNFKTHSFFSCTYTETDLPIPDYLKGSQIIFDKPIFAGENLNLSYKCVPSYFGQTGINLLGPVSSLTTSKEVPNSVVFTVYKRINSECSSLSCMDAGGGGDELLLKDTNGKIWSVPAAFFNSKYYSGNYLFVAGYYKNGQRLGTLDLQ